MKSKESSEHMKVFEWIKDNEEKYPVLMTIFHCPSSFFGTNFGVIMWLKKLGFRRGIYDLIIPISKEEYNGYWIEFKADGKKLSKEQNEIMNKILLYSDRPTKFEVFYDSEKCIESIKDYLKLAL
jgi:hypothetical protein